jgi:hypothetical protein
MPTTILAAKAPEDELEFLTTPDPSPQTLDTSTDCGVEIISVCISSRNPNCSQEGN